MKKIFTSIAVIFSLLFISSSMNGQDNPIRVACVGNSITWGGLGSSSYPEQLGALLMNGYRVKNFGVSARTLLRHGDYPYWNEETFYDAQDFNPQIVVIGLGTNDSKPQNWIYKNEFYKDYMDLIAVFRKDGRNPQIYACFPPPAFNQNWGITDAIIHYQIIPLIDSVQQAAKTLSINFYDYFRDKGNYFPDGIHPNADGYALMANVVFDSIKNSPAGFIRYFYSQSNEIEKNESTYLYWNASQGSQVTLNGNVANETDSLLVSPIQDTTYTLSAMGHRFSDTSEIILKYYPPGKIRYAAADPPILDLGSNDSSFISWITAKGTTDAKFNNSSVAVNGGIYVTPKQTTTYSLTTLGEISDTSLITVKVLESDSINRAAHKPAQASSFFRYNPVEYALDGKPDTYWKSKSAELQYITIDLIKYYTIQRIVLHWGNIFASKTYIIISDENGNIIHQKSYSNGDGGIDDMNDLTGSGHFVKILFMGKSVADSGYIVNEIEIYGTPKSIQGVSSKNNAVPAFTVEQNYPNPFNPMTVINYTITHQGVVNLVVFDMLGRKVIELVQQSQNPGSYQVIWNGQNSMGFPVSSGVYLYKITAGKFTETRKMILVR